MAERAVRLGAALVLLGAAQAAAADGKEIFGSLCVACHQQGGVGAAGVAPPLKSAVVRAAAKTNRDYVPLVLLNGLSGEIQSEGLTFKTVMPPQAQLSDADIAAVATYVYGTIAGAKTVKVNEKTVATLRATPRTAAELRAMRTGAAP